MATTITATIACAAAAAHKVAAASSRIVGLPQTRVRGGRVRCSMEKNNNNSGSSMAASAAASMLAAVGVMSLSNPAALALVDERMSTEGTGLSLGLSNNLLGWILLGVFGLIWSLYIVYTSGLDEDDDSGLSL